MLASLYGDGISAILLSTLLAQYFFVPPVHSLQINWPSDGVRLSIFLVSGLMIRQITNKLIKATENANAEKKKAQEAELWLSTTLASIGDAVIVADQAQLPVPFSFLH